MSDQLQKKTASSIKIWLMATMGGSLVSVIVGFVAGTLEKGDGKGFIVMFSAFPAAALVSIFLAGILSRGSAKTNSPHGSAVVTKWLVVVLFGVPAAIIFGVFVGTVIVASLHPGLGDLAAIPATAATAARLGQLYLPTSN